MMTGDASVNARAPIICCTAEVLANIALRDGADADVGQVVMDEFHFYSDPSRGWAWQVPLIELPRAQFILMSATLGRRHVLPRRTSPAAPGGRPRSIKNAERPVAARLLLPGPAVARDAGGTAHHQPGTRLRGLLHPGRRRWSRPRR